LKPEAYIHFFKVGSQIPNLELLGVYMYRWAVFPCGDLCSLGFGTGTPPRRTPAVKC
jgi:hypothetical protein